MLSYQLRNSIVLLVFLLILSLVGGFFNFYYYPSREKKENTEITKIRNQIRTLAGIEQEFSQLEKIIQEQQEKLSNLNKRLASQISPAETYDYLNTILRYSGIIEFNLYYVDKKASRGYNYTIFRLKGEGSFLRLYRFITLLEKGPEFYKIKSVKLTMTEEKDPESGAVHIVLPFDMELWALYADVEELPQIHRTLEDVSFGYVSNPFYPYIIGFIPPNTDKLLEVDRSELKAVLPDKALIADQTGQIRALAPGDAVYLGYLSKINLEQNTVEFILNKGGIVEKVTLELKFDKKIN